VERHAAVRIAGILSLTVITGVLAMNGVGDELVIVLALSVVAVAAPDALERLPFGPWGS
jgi:hypothetical protein